MHRKALYFVTKEKKVRHIGFTQKKQIQLLESREMLDGQGFDENSDFSRETDDSVYVFSSFIPQSVIDLWFGQILNGRERLRKPEKEKEKEKRKGKEKEKRNYQKIQETISAAKKRSKSKHRVFKLKKPSHTTDVKKIQNIQSRKQKRSFPRKKVPKRRKTLEMLKEEVKAQRSWESFVPTCGECVFWEKQYLEFTKVEIGGCLVTKNFVSSEKKACPEFEKQ